ncbi:acyltransferase [Hydrogenophaga sp.]|uniref:acyltransferase family protein n=1 Tax=Hydrogenophaga sp. TaxID=1904254 RepID=UPI002620D926|nr:acyltransferase [Hydrogenophaga sp.]MCW5653226.1 acyltransferase [Hydrogenophaga sp.]
MPQATAVAQPASAPHSHVLALDGIRGVAILLVLCYHLARSLAVEFDFVNRFHLVASFGWVGVDLFFVLSGFLITGILYDSKNHAHFFKNFYMRRALRIFPLYFCALLFLLLLRAAWPNLGLYGHQSDIWLWLYLTNFVIAVKDYGSFGLMDHFWSLAIEEQFYMLWPFVVFALNRRGAMAMALAMCMAAPLMRTAFAVTQDNPAALYVLSPFRMDSLAMGALLALAIRGGAQGIAPQKLRRPAMWAGGAAALGLLLTVAATRNVSPHTLPMETYGFSLVAVVGVCTIVLSMTTRLRQVFENGVLRWFGKYSYGLYVWHPILWMIIFHSELARSVRGGDGTGEMIGSIAVAVVVLFVFVMASWHLMESQFLKLKGRFQ